MLQCQKLSLICQSRVILHAKHEKTFGETAQAGAIVFQMVNPYFMLFRTYCASELRYQDQKPCCLISGRCLVK